MKQSIRAFTGVFIFCFFSFNLLAQNIDLETFNQKRLKINQYGMVTLGTWALGNIAWGAIRRNATQGQQQKFHEMNIYWNVVNLGLAGFGLYQSLRSNPGEFGLYESWKAQAGMEKILLFNAGLDVGYIMTGFFMQERSKNIDQRQDLWKGFGRSLVLQGSFLLVFDLALYLSHRVHLSRKESLFENISLNMNGESIGICLRF